MRKILTQKFFIRSSVEVAQDLLGKFIVRKINGKEIATMITETESYEGLDDLASHASKGRTKRTEVMFGPAGKLYVYLIYGMYFMLNVVTGEDNHPSAVLIRSTDSFSGPGRLTKGLFITKDLNAVLASLKSGLWFEDRGVQVSKKEVESTTRIGVEYSGPVWSKKPWRFVYHLKKK